MSRFITGPDSFLVPGTEETSHIPVTLICNEATSIQNVKKIYCTPSGKILIATYFSSSEKGLLDLISVDRLEAVL